MSSKRERHSFSEYDGLHVGIVLYDPETGAILDANDRTESIFGYTIPELRELSVETYTANTYRFSESTFVDRLQNSTSGQPQEFTWRVKRADGELIWVRIYLSRHETNGDSYIRAEFHDITDDYNTSHREELFWRLLRHNLRNKTNVITGHGEHIRSKAQTTSVRESAEYVQRAAADLGTIAESVKEIQLAISETDTQRSYRHATAAVTSVVNDVLPSYPDAEVTIEEHDSMWIHVDTAFTHALTEALENAIIHSTDAHPHVEVTVGPSPNTGRVEIGIHDSNPKIPDPEINALTNYPETTKTSHGTGVGLFVMLWCIESLGGELRFENDGSNGNTIYMYLPPRDPP